MNVIEGMASENIHVDQFPGLCLCSYHITDEAPTLYKKTNKTRWSILSGVVYCQIRI